MRVGDICVYFDRPNFILNPTSCECFQAVSTQGFKPKLSLKLKGGVKRGYNSELRVGLQTRPGDANILSVAVALPRSEFLDQAHIRTVCTRVQFALNQCPQGSIYGYVKAFTPLLDESLEGPVYLRSSNNLLPDLVVDLHGIVDIGLVGRIDSVDGGIRTTFAEVPDAPVTKFILEMQGGKKGLLVNSRNLCQSKNRAEVSFVGQNGKRYDSRPVVKADCGKKKGKKRNGGAKSGK